MKRDGKNSGSGRATSEQRSFDKELKALINSFSLENELANYVRLCLDAYAWSTSDAAPIDALSSAKQGEDDAGAGQATSEVDASGLYAAAGLSEDEIAAVKEECRQDAEYFALREVELSDRALNAWLASPEGRSNPAFPMADLNNKFANLDAIRGDTTTPLNDVLV